LDSGVAEVTPSNVIQHPIIEAKRKSDAAQFSDVWRRFMDARARADRVREMAFAGLVAANFTQIELDLITHLMSPYEHGVLKKIGRTVK
jgi:hypothetical protein